MRIKIDVVFWKNFTFLKKELKNLIVFSIIIIVLISFLGFYFPYLDLFLPFVSLIYITQIFGMCENVRDMMSGLLEAIAATHYSLKKLFFKDILFSAIVGFILLVFSTIISWIILNIFGCEIQFTNLSLSLILSILAPVGSVGLQREGGISALFQNIFLNKLLGFAMIPFYLFSFLMIFFRWAYIILWILSILSMIIFLILTFFGEVNKEAVINLWGN